MERVHEWLVYRHEVVRTPFRTLAAEMDLPKSTVQQFYARKSYPYKIWPKLRRWYVADRQARTTDDEPPDLLVQSALYILSGAPNATRPKFIRKLVASFREMYAAEKLPVPQWIDLLEETGEMAARAPEPLEDFEYRIPDSGRSDA